MTIETTYTRVRAGLAKFLDKVTNDREVVIIQRRGREDVAMISAAELASLTESAYLLRSPKNAERLLSALARALKKDGTAMTVEDLQKETEFEPEKA